MSGTPYSINQMSCPDTSSNNPSPDDAPSPPHTGIHVDIALFDVTPLDLDFSPYLSTRSSPPASRAPSEDLEIQIADDEPARIKIRRDPTPDGEMKDMELPIFVSRYANLGLNRVPARRPTRYSTEGRKLADGADSTRASPPSDNSYPHSVMDNEDLAQLESMMVPGEPPSSVHSTCSHWQPINAIRTSKYTTGILNTSGWQPIKNNSRSARGIVQTISVANKSSKDDSVPISPSDCQDGGELDTTEEFNKTTSFIWLDDKYFDHYGYLNQINGESVKIMDVSKASAATPEKSPKNAAQIQPIANSNSEPVWTYIQRCPSSLDADSTPEMPKRTETDAGPSKAMSMPGDDGYETYSNPTGEWELVEGNIEPPHINNVSPQKLVIKLRNLSTAELKTRTFPNMEHEDIDWTSRAHIVMICQWRNETFLRHGLDCKKHQVVYTPMEDAWFNLLHRKLQGSVEAGHMFRFPGPVPVMEAFNAYFEGKILKAADGNDTPPRSARNLTSMKSKLEGKKSKISKDRSAIRKLLEGSNSKELYVPVITEDDLAQFLEDGTVVIDDPSHAGKNRATMEDGKKTGRASPKRKQEETSEEQEQKRSKME